MAKELRSFRASLEAASAREDLFMGRKHLVVPVVALVQGVIHPSNASNPELALSQDFGKVPNGWNGRPLVMDHPQMDGQPTEANQPTILEDYQFGFIFNTRVEDDKLKTEAWIDLDRVHELGGDFERTVQRINSGEVIEVSTGFFADIDPIRGVYAQKRYNGVYRNFVPDHLAILPEGKVGACSVEGGCGTPRVNSSGDETCQEDTANLRVNRPKEASQVAKPKAAKCQCESQEGSCQCESHEDVAELKPSIATTKTPIFRSTSLQALGEPKLPTVELFQKVSQFFAATIPDAVLDCDVRRALSMACQEVYGPWVYVIGFTQTQAIYASLDDGRYLQVSFDMNADGDVDFTSEPQEVRLMTKIVVVESPEGSQADGNSPPVGASSSESSQSPSTGPSGELTTEEESTSEEPATQTQEVSMSDPKKPGAGSEATPAAPTTPSTPASVETAPAAPPVAASTPAPIPAAPQVPQTLEQFIASAPENLKGELAEALRVQSARKDVLISTLRATNRCDFSDDELRQMSLTQLESFAKLAGATVQGTPSEVPAQPANFAGVAAPQPLAASNQGVRSGLEFAPPPPRIWGEGSTPKAS
jgi:hypothetical protein